MRDEQEVTTHNNLQQHTIHFFLCLVLNFKAQQTLPKQWLLALQILQYVAAVIRKRSSANFLHNSVYSMIVSFSHGHCENRLTTQRKLNPALKSST